MLYGKTNCLLFHCAIESVALDMREHDAELLEGKMHLLYEHPS